MNLLLVASDAREFSGLLARCNPVLPFTLPLDWSRLAHLSSYDLLLATNGAGPKRAAAAVDSALQAFEPEAVVSIGFCGALSPDLRTADIVVGTAIAGTDRKLQVPHSSAPHRCGPVCSIDHVAQTAAEKKQLYASGAIAVEMEAAGLAARAEANSLPFYCIKAVTDLADETMANDFNAALRPDGHFDTMKILTSTLRHPWLRLPELIRLHKRCVRAARVLGDFIADCRF